MASPASPRPRRGTAGPVDHRSTAWLLSAAVAAGRLPGEPGVVLAAPARRSVLRRLFGGREWSPLADPRLEVVRAISASLARGAAAIRADLLAAADGVGLSRAELRRAFPGVAVEAVRT